MPPNEPDVNTPLTPQEVTPGQPPSTPIVSPDPVQPQVVTPQQTTSVYQKPTETQLPLLKKFNKLWIALVAVILIIVGIVAYTAVTRSIYFEHFYRNMDKNAQKTKQIMGNGVSITQTDEGCHTTGQGDFTSGHTDCSFSQAYALTNPNLTTLYQNLQKLAGVLQKNLNSEGYVGDIKTSPLYVSQSDYVFLTHDPYGILQDKIGGCNYSYEGGYTGWDIWWNKGWNKGYSVTLTIDCFAPTFL